MNPRLWVFAGPNGAGKSSLVRRLVGSRLPVINPDNYVDQSVVQASAAQLNAGRRALAERETMLAAGASFAIETTLSGRTEIDLIRRARQVRYRVSLVYVGLTDVRLSIGRVRSRVARGGHVVPLPDLLRRFDRSLVSLLVLAPLVDRLVVIDNSGTAPRLLLRQEGSRLRRRASVMPLWALAIAEAVGG